MFSVVGLRMFSGSLAFCRSAMVWMTTFCASSLSGSKSEKRGLNFQGTKLCLKIVSSVRSMALETIREGEEEAEPL